MSDLLSRCKLFNKLATAQTLADAFAVIQGMEPEDAEYVVRCRNCIHLRTRQNEPYCSQSVTFVNEDDFCAWGEEKGDQNGKAD